MNKLNQPSREIIKYTFSSGVITILSFLYFYFFNKFFSYTITYIITFLMGVCSQFVVQHLFVFNAPVRWWKLPLMVGNYAFQALIVYVALVIFIEVVVMSSEMSFILATLVGFPVTYFMNKTLVKS